MTNWGDYNFDLIKNLQNLRAKNFAIRAFARFLLILEAIPAIRLYLFLAKEARKRIPLLSGLKTLRYARSH